MELCSYVLYAANLVNPAEYCDEDAVDGEEFCEVHMPYEQEDLDLYLCNCETNA